MAHPVAHSYSRKLDIGRADAIILSACVQMPSLRSVDPVERIHGGLPVLSATTTTAYKILSALNLDPAVPGAGHRLSGNITANHRTSVDY